MIELRSDLISNLDHRIIVISDIHIGAGELDDFTSELEVHLVAFINGIGSDQCPVELVINGDFFDFATAEPWEDQSQESKSKHGEIPLCFTEDQSCRKLENIIKAHGPVFDALVTFLRTSKLNRVTILPGNHDADLFWTRIRRRLTDCLTSQPEVDNDQLAFVLERHYVITRGNTRYWIEHGHQHDPPNSFFVSGDKECWSLAFPPIFFDSQGWGRLYECPGTLGLVRYINRWRLRYKSISYIKPYSRLLMALAGHKAFKEPGRPIHLCWQLAHMLGWDVDWKTALAADDDLRLACHALLQEIVHNLAVEEIEEFKIYLEAHSLSVTNTLENFVGTEIRRDRVISCVAAAGGAQETAKAILRDNTSLGFIGNSLIDIESRALVSMAKRLIENGQADYVLTGHTHVPKVSLNGRFLNGGCWIPNQNVDSIGRARRIIFEHGSVPYELTYLQIKKDEEAPEIKTYATGHVFV